MLFFGILSEDLDNYINAFEFFLKNLSYIASEKMLLLIILS